MEDEKLIDCTLCGYTHREIYDCAAVSASAQLPLLYVLAGTRRLAENYAESLNVPPQNLRDVRSPFELKGLKRGLTLHVHGVSASNNPASDEIIKEALSRDWKIEYV